MHLISRWALPLPLPCTSLICNEVERERISVGQSIRPIQREQERETVVGLSKRGNKIQGLVCIVIELLVNHSRIMRQTQD